jgi:hypothetical protein
MVIVLQGKICEKAGSRIFVFTRLQKTMHLFSLSMTDTNTVKVARKTENNRRIRDRMKVLHLLHTEYNRQKTARIVDCHPNTITR